MCGITGIVSPGGGWLRREWLAAMTGALQHRGPDDWGVYVNQEGPVAVGLGHRRLSIIDLSSAGRQPMSNEDGSVWVTFNGEIYNFQDIRQELEKHGHRFSSDSDTEVLVHGYEQYGPALFEKLNGMFALAIWDDKRQQLLMARDRFGQKPLYYSSVEGQLLFASELKALIAHPRFDAELDVRGLSRFLLYEYLPAPCSIYKGVQKLPQGCYLLWNKGQIEVESYWRPRYPANEQKRFEQRDLRERLVDLLRSSIKRRLISDVPLGVFLSGGIDSSSIVALMAEMMPAKQIKTFSIGFREASFDESGYAREIAHRFGTDHYEQELTAARMLDILPEIWEILDEPFADASLIPTYLLSKFTRQSVTVALGGDGGDELFAGYDPFVAHKLARWYQRVPRGIHRHLFQSLASRLPASTRNMSLDFRIKQFLKGAVLPAPLRNQVWLGAFSRDEQQQLFTGDVLSELRSFDPYGEILRQSHTVPASNWLDQIIYLYTHYYLAGDILTKVDRASMAVSLEVRAPFLDVEFAEFVNQLPAGLKMNGFTRKYLLKKSMEVYLPKKILYRPKKGFGIPLSAWFKGPLKPLLLEVFDARRMREAGLFRPEVVQNLLDDHFSGRRDNRKQIWALLVFEMWRERYHKSANVFSREAAAC